MAVRPIVRYPDLRLKMPAAQVETFDGALATLVEDLRDTMLAAPGIGIAGAHIGVLLAVAVIQLGADMDVRVFVNPKITASTGVPAPGMEGSVSMPGITEEVLRPQAVTVRYQTLDGTVMEERATGLMSVCLQHEIDQINGIFWLQRLSRLKRERLVKRYGKQRA